MINAKSIGFFENLAQYNYNNQYYDFHNDYYCENLSYSDGILLIQFKSFVGNILIKLKFIEVYFCMFNFFNVNGVDNLTIDNIHRGRFELNGNLIEVSKDGKGYFYLDFCEGQKLEFWATAVSLE